MLRAPFILVWNLVSLLVHLWSRFWFKLGYFFRRKKKLYLTLKLESSYAFGPRTGLARYFQQKPSFLELRKSIERIRDDDTVAGVVLVPEATAMGHGQLEELYRLFDSLRDAGKHLVAHAQMPMTRDYLLASAADDIVMSPAGRLYSFGPRFDQYFAHEALEKLGVVPQFVHIGEFKTASHRFIHEHMTEAQRLMMQALYDRLKGEMLARIGERRQLPAAQVEQLFAQAPMDTRQAWRQGFVDGEVFREALSDWLDSPRETTPVGRLERRPNQKDPDQKAKKGHKDKGVVLTNATDYLDSAPERYQWRPLFRRPRRFAVLDLTGMIVMPNMSVPGQGSVVIDPHEVLPALRSIRENRRYAGAILHINSPGGSALASDIIWHAIEQLRRTKPVVAQCSDVVGSGGYYLAVGTDEIICERTTLTGSIGVITGKMSVPGVPQKLGVNFESIYEHDADLFSSLTHPLSDEMMQRMDDDARSFYRRFLQRVGQARKLPRRRLHRYARGRVYLGEDARHRGLVDHIGGIDVAVDRLCELCDMPRDKASLSYVAHRRENLRSALRGSIQTEVSAHIPDWLARAFEPATLAAMLEHDPVLALMPFRVK